MQSNELFTIALGLSEPWYVSKVTFEPEGGELHLWLDFSKGARFICSVCGDTDATAYDTKERTWRHLNFFQRLSQEFVGEPTPQRLVMHLPDRK